VHVRRGAADDVVVAVLGFGEREAGVDLRGLPGCVAGVRGFFGSAAGPARSIVALTLEAIPQIAATRTLKCRYVSGCCNFARGFAT
jgi:hypothetical protein